MKSIRRSFPYKQINKNIVYLAVKIDRGTTTGGCDCDITIQDGENLSVADLFRVESDTVLCHRNCALVLDVLGFLLSLTISSRYYIECNRILRSSIIVHNKEILKDFSLTNSYTLIINNHYTGGRTTTQFHNGACLLKRIGRCPALPLVLGGYWASRREAFAAPWMRCFVVIISIMVKGVKDCTGVTSTCGVYTIPYRRLCFA